MSGRKCPRCESPYTEQIPRNLFERLFTQFTRFRKFMCLICQRRFWRPVVVRSTSEFREE